MLCISANAALQEGARKLIIPFLIQQVCSSRFEGAGETVITVQRLLYTNIYHATKSKVESNFLVICGLASGSDLDVN